MDDITDQGNPNIGLMKHFVSKSDEIGTNYTCLYHRNQILAFEDACSHFSSMIIENFKFMLKKYFSKYIKSNTQF